jgi:hypothetical protein
MIREAIMIYPGEQVNRIIAADTGINNLKIGIKLML